MSDAIYSALSGAVAQQTALEYTAQNLANASTGGFLSSQPVFQDVLAQATAGGPPIHLTVITGSRLEMTPGELTNTGRPLDVALAPRDFLAVSTARGERYTRAGALRVGAGGTLDAVSGDPVLGEDGNPVRVNLGSAVVVGTDGSVQANGTTVARLRVVTFAQPESLSPEGATLLSVGSAGAPTPSTQPIQVGMLEGSNESAIRGMTEMLQATRLFDSFQRAIQAFHDADQQALNVAKP